MTYAFHPVSDPVAVINRRVAHMAVQRRLGILSQRRLGLYSLDRVAGRFAALAIGVRADSSHEPTNTQRCVLGNTSLQRGGASVDSYTLCRSGLSA